MRKKTQIFILFCFIVTISLLLTNQAVFAKEIKEIETQIILSFNKNNILKSVEILNDQKKEIFFFEAAKDLLKTNDKKAISAQFVNGQIVRKFKTNDLRIRLTPNQFRLGLHTFIYKNFDLIKIKSKKFFW